MKNQVAENLQAKYEDLSLYLNEKRIPEPFCLVDMGVQSGANIIVQVAEGAVFGAESEEKLRQ